MVFMKASMNRVWSFYNMLQLASNIKNYTTLYIPSNALFIFEILENTTFFKITSQPAVEEFLSKYIFKNAKVAQDIIFGQGPLITAIVFVFGTLILVKVF
jgi:hypothetical protein